MKGKYVVIGKNGETYHYRYLAAAFNKYWAIYGTLASIAHLDAHLLSLAY